MGRLSFCMHVSLFLIFSLKSKELLESCTVVLLHCCSVALLRCFTIDLSHGHTVALQCNVAMKSFDVAIFATLECNVAMQCCKAILKCNVAI